MDEEPDDVYCMECNQEFEGEYPGVGKSIECPNCGAEGYGTYSNDENMFYEIEWYPPSKS